MTVLGFLLRLHSPLRVGAAYARDGVDAALDHDDPLPADHLKGVIRDAAAELLAADHPLVTIVFGAPEMPSVWAWTSAAPVAPQAWEFTRRHRVTIDAGTHTAVKDHLVLGEQAWAPTVRFEIHRVRSIDPLRAAGHGYTEAEHITLLRAAVCAVHGLGAWRRRGLGWVGAVPEDGLVTEKEVSTVLRWREDGR